MADHSHSHAPGEDCSHNHGPQSPGIPQPDPAAQALIDADFVPTPLALHPDPHTAVCSPHKLEKCDKCNVDFVNTNRLAKLLVANPSLLCPPPNNVVSQQLSQMALFKSGQAGPALGRYTAAAQLAVQRPPWEANQFMREELSTVISNRSAAYFDLGDYISALADAEAVISLRRNWPKGHFRKAKALLGMHKTKEAAESVRLGLSFEPQNSELLTFLNDIEKMQQKLEEKRSQKSTPAVSA
ncbi:hypothetical protein H1R20_g10827, partial [Candolleomyces eurysporus]